MMISPANALIYLIELINSYACIYYSNFFYFFLQRTFGFNGAENLLTASLGGIVYIVAAWQGGKWVERSGGIRVLTVSSCGIMAALTLGLICATPVSQIMVFGLWTVSICCVWPALETLISVRAGASLLKMLGIYNVTWAAGGALAYFTAGILIEKLGMASVFWVPLGLTVIELALLPFAAQWLKKENYQCPDAPLNPEVSPADAKQFLRMAWLANPFCYVAINTVVPLVPSIAEKLHLTTGMAGIVCSLWMFARLAAFAFFWRWTDWHYRFQWLAGSFLLLIVCFFGFLIAKSIGLLLLAQVGFGLSIGLIYYSSLYYSMNVTENQGANAGIHEAMIGAGMFIGPAFGAATLYLVPVAIGIGAWSVGGLLCAGFSGMLFMRHCRSRKIK